VRRQGRRFSTCGKSVALALLPRDMKAEALPPHSTWC
jgi:hypothetical protein